MLYTIKNSHLTASVDTLGAQLMSLQTRDGLEFLWQGDPAYWSKRAPVLFPVIGRLEGRQYQLDGQIYPMPTHGFASHMEFIPVSHAEDTLILALHSTPDTQRSYPYRFVLEITYHLSGSTLSVASRVYNQSDRTMHFALGGHPGFQVPLEQDASFTDYHLEFDRETQPERIAFTGDTVLVTGDTIPYPLEEGKRLPLRHELFDEDAIILRNMARQVTLKSHGHDRSVTLSCPDAPYLGFWNCPHSDAPFLCIEPWTSLPGRSGITEDLALREDFIHLDAGNTYENTWTVTVC